MSITELLLIPEQERLEKTTEIIQANLSTSMGCTHCGVPAMHKEVHPKVFCHENKGEWCRPAYSNSQEPPTMGSMIAKHFDFLLCEPTARGILTTNLYQPYSLHH